MWPYGSFLNYFMSINETPRHIGYTLKTKTRFVECYTCFGCATTKTEIYRILVIFKICLRSPILFKRSRRELSIDMAEHTGLCWKITKIRSTPVSVSYQNPYSIPQYVFFLFFPLCRVYYTKKGFVIPTKSFVKTIAKHFVTTTKCLVLSTKRLVAAAKFLVAATKNYLMSLILLPNQTHFFPCTFPDINLHYGHMPCALLH